MEYKTSSREFRERWIEFILDLQKRICAGLEAVDGSGKFITDPWERAEGKGGGGITRVMSNGAVFEKAGVNTSVVFGNISDRMRKALGTGGEKWFACGLSLVIHPLNPFVPTTHANWRYFELYDENDHIQDRWFGGGADLTPYYLFEQDASHFHKSFKNALDPYGADLYPEFKNNCDQYFNNSHRGFEMRGIGGVFYDHLRATDSLDLDRLMQLQMDSGNTFLEAYLPIVQRRMDTVYNDKQVYWQQIRRGRYVEFNLIHDKGTTFGLKTNGRTESILMSLPPTVRFDYNYQPALGSEEQKLLYACQHPRDWV